jgi:D-arabinose 1-dehydrogenase-like Zn-dependent alcohol dehydrogenase
MDFVTGKSGLRGPNLLRTIRSISRDQVPKDIRSECFENINEDEGAKPGDWIAIWGGEKVCVHFSMATLTRSGSSASGCCAVQLAKLAGLKVIAVIDVAKNGERMLKHGADLLVDRFDPDRAIDIVKGITKGKLRFGLDTRGKESALLLAQAMKQEGADAGRRAHLVGLTGLPKEPTKGVVYHSVPIKAFHEAPQVGEGLMIWLEKLLEQKLLATLDIEVAEGGLQGINDALDKLRSGAVNGPRIVVPLTT